jgi:hypothetical protein
MSRTQCRNITKDLLEVQTHINLTQGELAWLQGYAEHGVPTLEISDVIVRLIRQAIKASEVST